MKNLFRTALLLPVVFATSGLSAQTPADAQAEARMRAAVEYLASDALEGRETGTAGERLAYIWLTQQFTELGLSPAGTDGYLQAFGFAGQPKLAAAPTLQLGRKKLVAGTDFYVVPWSGSGLVRSKVARANFGIVAPDLGRNDYEDLDTKDRAVAIRVSSPDGIHPHSKWIAHHDLGDRIALAVQRGANAVILYNDDPQAADPDSTFRARIKEATVPVIFLTAAGSKHLGANGDPVVLNVQVDRPRVTGHNVVAFRDLGKERTVVVGAHYDHVGWGDEGSRHRGERAIHNGADDNASGTAMLVELARTLGTTPGTQDHNYLFIAFSGEEKGLYGSKHWTNEPTHPLDRVAYMLNMDMVGRLDSASTFLVNGVGTSPIWAAAKEIKAGNLDVRTSESGTGPSDHASFYFKEIPAVHFFTGTHADYHKPEDDAHLINYPGMLRILRYIEAMVARLDAVDKPAFTKTKEADTSAPRRFSVSLGIMPDYMYDGQGLRLDGVTEGRAAAAAGMQAGDIILRLGDRPINDMQGYMEALGGFKKGDSTTVTFKRGEEELTRDISFQ